MSEKTIGRDPVMDERAAPAANGMGMLLLNILLELGTIALFCWGVYQATEGTGPLPEGLNLAMIIVTGCYYCLLGPLVFMGFKVLKPREALVLTLFGKYYGTLRGPGFFFVNPFVSVMNPVSGEATSAATTAEQTKQAAAKGNTRGKALSLKVMTLNNDQQKINDQLGNPIIIGIAVIWKVVNTAKAVFNVDNYIEYLSIQCDAALRGIVRLYPYDNTGEGEDNNEETLRGSSQEISGKLREEIQSKVEVAGLEILEARITHLSYAPEIAAVMLQRQQASAVIAARQMIVDGAVGMVEMALSKLSDKNIVNLDEERKASMVSNLLVVLCSNKETQPIVNSGSIY
ncbi:MAG: SPFH domain-containing protein [Treponema sp.]|jgi:regulator of protease activity HflC (stomatin/prohibitin superfamily)|nr:SPFH domain-containing protein [Treponema sp.]